ncbi:hypothetical protein CHUAL_001256 [Chamberlinius hualienensis]
MTTIYKVSEISHSKRNIVCEIDLKKLRKCCRPLLFFMTMAGINIEFTQKKPNCSSHLVWLFRFFIFIVGIYMFTFQVFSLKNGLGADDLWILCFNDHLAAWAFLYIICVRAEKISQFSVKMIKASIEKATIKHDVIFQQIRKVSLTLTLISVLFVIYEPVFIYYHTKSNVKCDSIFAAGYFGMLAPPTLRGLFAFVSEVAHWYICFVAELYGAFIIFLIYILGIGYRNINKSFMNWQNLTIEKVNNFQQQHYHLNSMTNKFNQLFSPAILIYVCCLMGQVIGAPGNVTAQITHLINISKTISYAPFTFFCHAILPTTRAIYILLLLFKMSHTVHQQSREVFDRLLQMFLTHPELHNNSHKDLILNCNKTTLLSAQWSASPTAITASGLFTLDYTLIGVLLSITVTYWTLLGDLKGGIEASTAINITCRV